MWFDDMMNDFDLFDDVFRAPFWGNEALMRTDVHEKDGKYIVEMDLPGYDKNDVQISLKNGNLTIHAEHHEDGREKGRVVRNERFAGSCSRTFYVGNNVHQEDIKASFHNGTLRIEIPDGKKQVEAPKQYIEIE